MAEALDSAVFKPHHRAWLAAHPHRTARWLRDALSEGFDVHHMDGDHDNNDPANLVLIEASDHQRLHGRPDRFHIRSAVERWGEIRRERLLVGRAAYDLRRNDRLTWREVAERLDLGSDQYPALCAREYAVDNGLEWPAFTLSREERAVKVAERAAKNREIRNSELRR